MSHSVRDGVGAAALEHTTVLSLVSALSAPGDFGSLTARIAAAALELTGSAGAYIEAIVSPDGEIEVVASVGSGVPDRGTRVPYPGSLTEEIIEDGIQHLIMPVGSIGGSMTPYLARTCDGCTALVVPMRIEGRPMGAIVLLRKPTQPTFPEHEVTTAVLLAEISGVALHRHESERELREREHRFRALAENAADAIVTIAEDDTIRFVNAAAQRIFGYSADEMIGSPFSMLIPERFRERHRAGMKRFIQTGKRNIPWDGIELPGLHREGHEVPLEVTFGEYVDDGRHVFTGMMRDITARVQAQDERARLLAEAQQLSEEAAGGRAELERAMASKARLIRGFAHDIKNPLGAANGRAELLLEGVVGELSDATREQIEGIRRSVQTSLELVTTLVEFTRVEAGQIDLEQAPTELGPLARQVADDYSAAASRNGVELNIEDRGAPPVETDTARVRQILDNLVSNAVKYTPDGTITIVVEPAAEMEREQLNACAAVRVLDTGRGIPADRVQELFLEFSRIDPVDKSGAGLGLAISRRLAHLLGGEITVETEEGRGSTFSLLLA